MANFWVAILSITLIVSVALFQIVMSPGGSESSITIASKGIRGQEMVAVKHYRKRINQAAVTYSNHEQAPPKDSRYERRTVRPVHKTEAENRGSRISLRERELERKISYSKREIPGGPDGQHHRRRGM